MYEGVLSLLNKAGISVLFNGSNLRAKTNFSGLEVKIMKPQNIGKLVENGKHDIGITGYDWIVETKTSAIELLDLRLYNGQIVAAISKKQQGKIKDLYILVVGLSYGFLAAGMVEASAFQAIGKSWPGFWILVIKFLAISIPLAYLFTQVLGFSIIGIWIAVLVGNILSSVVGYFWITRTLSKMTSQQVPVHHLTSEDTESFEEETQVVAANETPMLAKTVEETEED